MSTPSLAEDEPAVHAGRGFINNDKWEQIMASMDQVRADLLALPEADQKTLVAGLPTPGSDNNLTMIWIILLLILAGIIFFFGYLSYQQVSSVPAKSADLLFAPVTLAVGALIGLFAPSPVKK